MGQIFRASHYSQQVMSKTFVKQYFLCLVFCLLSQWEVGICHIQKVDNDFEAL
jgi:hypothetical protein